MHPSSKVFLETTNTQPEIAVILGSGLTNFFEPQNIIKARYVNVYFINESLANLQLSTKRIYTYIYINIKDST